MKNKICDILKNSSNPNEKWKEILEGYKLFYKDRLTEASGAQFVCDFLQTSISVIDDEDILSLACHTGGDASLGLKKVFDVVLKERNLFLTKEKISIEVIISSMYSEGKSQKSFTEENIEYDFLSNFIDKVIDFNEKQYRVSYLESENYSFLPIIIISREDSMIEKIVTQMKNENKNPMYFDSYSNKKEYNYLKSLSNKKFSFKNYEILIEIIPGSGFGQGETDPEAKVFLLSKL